MEKAETLARRTHQVVDAHLVAATEAFAIGLALLGGQMGMTVFLPIIYIGAAMVIEVLARAFDPIPEALPANPVEFIGSRVPGAIRGAHPPIRSAGQVSHGAVVSTAETFAIGRPHGRWDVWMPVLVAVVDVGTAMIAKVSAGAFNTVVEAPALNVVPGVGRTVPVIAILPEGRRLRTGG